MERHEFAAALAGAAAAARPTPASQGPDAGRSPGSITDVPGLKVGHFTDSRRPTGCPALLFDAPAAAGVDYDGSAPGETQVVLLQPITPPPESRIAWMRSSTTSRWGTAASGPIPSRRARPARRPRPPPLPRAT